MRAELLDEATPQERMRERLRPWLRRLAFYLVLLALWETIVQLGLWPPWVFPGPLSVFTALGVGIWQGSFLSGALVSLRRLAFG
jgi:NitT/TauT family transport system permease protein